MTHDMNLQFVADTREHYPSNYQKFLEYQSHWNANKEKIVDVMQKSTGLEFRHDVPSLVHEYPWNMSKINGQRIPGFFYKSNTTQNFLSESKYTFVDSEVHERWHALFNQNWDLVGDHIINFKEGNGLTDMEGDHVHVYAGMRRVNKEVFGEEADKYNEASKWWEHLNPKKFKWVRIWGPQYARALERSENFEDLLQDLREHVRSAAI